MTTISKGTQGAVNELRICANLLSLGWQVFRNISPNGSTDLVAVKGRIVLKVQVKASLNGQYKHLRCGSNQLLAIIGSRDGEIRYRATSKRIARLFPACGLVRRPRRHTSAT